MSPGEGSPSPDPHKSICAAQIALPKTNFFPQISPNAEPQNYLLKNSSQGPGTQPHLARELLGARGIMPAFWDGFECMNTTEKVRRSRKGHSEGAPGSDDIIYTGTAHLGNHRRLFKASQLPRPTSPKGHCSGGKWHRRSGRGDLLWKNTEVQFRVHCSITTWLSFPRSSLHPPLASFFPGEKNLKKKKIDPCQF